MSNYIIDTRTAIHEGSLAETILKQVSNFFGVKYWSGVNNWDAGKFPYLIKNGCNRRYRVASTKAVKNYLEGGA